MRQILTNICLYFFEFNKLLIKILNLYHMINELKVSLKEDLLQFYYYESH